MVCLAQRHHLRFAAGTSLEVEPNAYRLGDAISGCGLTTRATGPCVHSAEAARYPSLALIAAP